MSTYRTVVGVITTCTVAHHSGRLCQREHGHQGAHMNFTNGTLAWGASFDNTPRTGFRS
jgi:hypothetical protein